MSFDRVARIYHPGERLVFGRALQKCRTAFLADATRSRRALILGEGDGRFLAALLRVNPCVQIDCVDSSPSMVVTATARVAAAEKGWRDRVRFICADARDWLPPARSYDLLVTHFFLDCFDQSEAEKLVDKIGAAAGPGALWLIAEFSLPAGGLAHWRARAWVFTLYRFFRCITGITARRLPVLGQNLAANGFHLEAGCASLGGMVTSQRWRLRSH